LKRHLTGN